MMGFGFGGFGIIFMVLFWGILIFGGVWLAKSLIHERQGNQSGITAPRQPSAREILEQRYARGEISREEYEQIKGDL
ncbi:MAG: SHOCT domain-containing protein [Anaerolineales bacterium]|nr:SHOCT domain-containing protein [Chloroflexota bacterium]MBL6980360.1 SHOCT domain-containing protein [Anaerolineales bacterium]